MTSFIEERNYLLFTITERKPTELKEVMGWSLESFYQFLYANSVQARKTEAAQKTAEEKRKAMSKRK